MPMTNICNGTHVKKTLERRLEFRAGFDDKPVRPLKGKKLITFIEDLHMPFRDNYGS
jgi:hypothetical protein